MLYVNQGIESQTLLASTIKYFETACHIKDADDVQLKSNREAEIHLKKLLIALEKEVSSTDLLISQEKAAIDEERKSIMTGFLDGLQDPQLQTVGPLGQYKDSESLAYFLSFDTLSRIATSCEQC